jgi:hypothetical protein
VVVVELLLTHQTQLHQELLVVLVGVTAEMVIHMEHNLAVQQLNQHKILEIHWLQIMEIQVEQVEQHLVQTQVVEEEELAKLVELTIMEHLDILVVAAGLEYFSMVNGMVVEEEDQIKPAPELMVE